MPTATASVIAKAPIDVVFGVCTDLEKWPDMVEDIQKIEILSDGELGVGTRFRETRTMFGKEATEVMEFTEIEPNKGFVLLAESHGARYVTPHTFEEVEGGTKMTVTMNATAVSLFAKLMIPITSMMMGSIRKALQKDLEELKKHAEAAAAA